MYNKEVGHSVHFYPNHMYYSTGDSRIRQVQTTDTGVHCGMCHVYSQIDYFNVYFLSASLKIEDTIVYRKILIVESILKSAKIKWICIKYRRGSMFAIF